MVQGKGGVNRQAPAEISGQERAVRVFSRIMKKGRLAHAYLLVGPSGVGKEALAFFLAKLLLCENPDLTGDMARACDSCAGCRKFEHQAHPDLEILRPQGAMIKVEQIRDLQRVLSFSPLEARCRVSLILEAQRINLSAANALLKTLEEPPSGNHLILTASSARTILPTIVSRCQVIRCAGLSAGLLKEFIEEKGLCPPDSVGFLTCFSEGSISRAGDMIECDVLSVRERLLDFLRREREAAIPMLFVLSKQMSGDREDILLAVQVIRTIFRDLMILKGIRRERGGESGRPGDRLVNHDFKSELLDISQLFDSHDLVEYSLWLDRVEWLLDRNVSREFLMEFALIFWIIKRRQRPAVMPSHERI